MEQLFALLLSTDPASLGTTQKVLEGHGVTVKVAGSIAAANQLIKTSKFDMGVYDNDVPGALDLAGKSSLVANPKMIFGLMRNNTLSNAAGKRVHFVIQKPLTADLFARSLRAAYGTMIRDRRISFRHPVQIKPLSAVLLQEKGNQPLHAATILDLSQTGLCIQTLEILPQNATLELEFQLPESKEIIHATGSVMWTRASGRTGIKLSCIAPTEQKNLIAWLDSLLPYQIDMIPRPSLRHEHSVVELHA